MRFIRFVIGAMALCVSSHSLGTGDDGRSGNVQAGRTKAAAACAGCHGEAGRSATPDWPNLAGQHARYLLKQLDDFKSGKRLNEVMNPIATDLTAQDVADLAAYFAAQTRATEQASSGSIDYGKRIYRSGVRERGIPSCMGCHGPSGAGNPAAGVPALAGQKASYTANQLRSYRSSERGNDRAGVMRGVAGNMSDDGLEAVSAYLAGLQGTSK